MHLERPTGQSKRVPDGLLVNGEPLVFYHFSGLDGGDQEVMLREYGARMPALWKLRQWYLEECARMGQAEYAAIAWSYGYFDNGRPVTAGHRLLYRGRVDLQRAFPDPFSTTRLSSSYYHWFEAEGSRSSDAGPVPADGPAKLTPRENFAIVARQSHPAPYRIFLSVEQNQSDAALSTAASLLENTESREPFFLLGPASVVSNLGNSGAGGNRLQPIPLPEGSGHDDAFERVLRDFADQDFAFVEAGVLLPEHWDLRLAWSAARLDGVATVSPVCDSRVSGPKPAPLLDRICYQQSYFEHPEIACFLRECVFVRAEAARVAAGPPRGILRRGDARKAFNEAARSLRFSHVLADHLCVRGARPHGVEQPEPVRGYLPESTCLSSLRRKAGEQRSSNDSITPQLRSRSRNLHLMHSWGGGLDRWVQQYCRADTSRDNLVLKSTGAWGAFGMQLDLYGPAGDPRPVQSWSLSPGIKGTACRHSGYRRALEEIIHRYGIERIFVSSLIGHSLEALQTGLPALFICHDFYPWCPAINITFHGVCTSCGQGELTACTRENPHNRFFDNLPPQFWMDLRAGFLASVNANPVLFVAPTDSARRHWCQLAPDLKDHFLVVPHGSEPLARIPLVSNDDSKPLRVLVLGSLAPHKGRFLLEEIAGELLSFAELYLLGCGEDGSSFANRRGVTVIPTYQWTELPELVQQIQPDVGLLLSVYPETFCYTLQELFELNVPPLATRLGSFEERINDGVNGFLCEPDGSSVLRRLRELARDREKLAEVRATLSKAVHRAPEEMIADYDQILMAPSLSPKAYFLRPERRDGGPAGPVTCQLFWLTNSPHFDEALSSSVRAMPAPENVRLPLRIAPQPEAITALRLDLADRPGLVLLEAVRIYDSDENMIWESPGPELLVDGRFSGMIPVAGSGEDKGQLLFLTDPESILLLSPGPDVLRRIQKGGLVELECSWPAHASHPAAIEQLFSGEGARELSPAERDTMLDYLEVSSGFQMRVRAEQNVRRAAAAQERLASIENSWSWRVTAPLRRLGRYALQARSRLSRTWPAQ